MKKAFIVFTDILLIPFALSAPRILSAMIERGKECYFLKHGILCPSCGGTRCLYSFFTGNFKQAFLYNSPIFCGLLLGFFLVCLLNMYVLFDNKYCMKTIRLLISPIFLTALTIAYVIFGLFRNFL